MQLDFIRHSPGWGKVIIVFSKKEERFVGLPRTDALAMIRFFPAPPAHRTAPVSWPCHASRIAPVGHRRMKMTPVFSASFILRGRKAAPFPTMLVDLWL